MDLISKASFIGKAFKWKDAKHTPSQSYWDNLDTKWRRLCAHANPEDININLLPTYIYTHVPKENK